MPEGILPKPPLEVAVARAMRPPVDPLADTDPNIDLTSPPNVDGSLRVERQPAVLCRCGWCNRVTTNPDGYYSDRCRTFDAAVKDSFDPQPPIASDCGATAADDCGLSCSSLERGP